jgi:hypothetical protein
LKHQNPNQLLSFITMKCALDYFGLGTNVVFGLGLLVMFIGIGQMFAGYVYPNQPYKINKASSQYLFWKTSTFK